MAVPNRVDGQVVELIGRNYLVTQLLRDGLEVARPERDRGIDLIAFVEGEPDRSFVACPIQMKAATGASFSVYRKYERFPTLLFAYVWYVDDPNRTTAYLLSLGEVFDVAEEMGWTKTGSLRSDAKRVGAYTTNRPSQRLLGLLEPHRMEPGRWREKFDDVTKPLDDGSERELS